MPPGVRLFLVFFGLGIIGCVVAVTINKTAGGVIAVPALVLAVGFKGSDTRERGWPPKYR